MEKTRFISAILILTFSGLFCSGVYSQTKAKDKEVKIMTSAQCGMCKDRIEGSLIYEPGIKDVVLNLENKVVTVTYNPAKTDENKIRLALNKLGYDADNMPADPEAYKKLPKCCQKGGHEGVH